MGICCELIPVSRQGRNTKSQEKKLPELWVMLHTGRGWDTFIFLGKCSPRSFGGCRPLVVACMPNFRSWACGRKTFPEIYPRWRPVFVKDTGQILIGKTMDIPFLHDIEQPCMLEPKTLQIKNKFIASCPRKSKVVIVTIEVMVLVRLIDICNNSCDVVLVITPHKKRIMRRAFDILCFFE